MSEKTAAPATASPLPPAAEDTEIAYCRIHPGLGIARIGNSPDEFFIGPESPGTVVEPAGGYKDEDGQIKRQAARFRIYAYDKNDRPIKELTAADANITWTVHLANRKAAYSMFLGAYWQSQYPEFYKQNPDAPPPRNQEIPADSPERSRLVIDPGPRSVSGISVKGPKFDGGTIGPLPYTEMTPYSKVKPECVRGSRTGYLNVAYPDLDNVPPKHCHWTPGKLLEPVALSDKVEVPLGELRTDPSGRLLVLGGAGKSGSLIPNNPLGFLNVNSYFANNDYWYDDVSDGPVSAEVVLKNGASVEVKDKAWVLVGVPKFVPAAETLTPLYDVAMDAVGANKPDAPVSFVRDIYPILKRLDIFTWLNKTANRGHGSDTAQGSFIGDSNPIFKLLRSNSMEERPRDMRQHVFQRLRMPGLVPPTPQAQDTEESKRYANAFYMPQMSGDGGEATNLQDSATPPPGGAYVTWLTLSPTQYAKMKRWAAGDFEADWPHDGVLPPPKPLGMYPIAEQPAALDRAALEPCVGGAFYPGIEMTYIARDPDTWSGPCRINQSFLPGAITQHMALPWQADFSECNTNWWPAQRPDDVVPEAEFESIMKTYDPQSQAALSSVLADRQPWARGIQQESPGLDNDMVTYWKDFGFVVKKEVAGQEVYIETERSPYVGDNMRDYFYYLMNISAYEDFIPRAHSLVHELLAEAWKNQDEADPDEVWKFFPFTQEAFDARLELIYDNFVRDANSATAAQTYLMQTREQVVNQILQIGPFNQLDGVWLRGITPDGPLGLIDSLMFSIRMDEMGDGNVQQNHANVYTDLLKSLNIYLPDLHTREYANNPALYDSSFVQPVFLLAISQFGDEFMPELLGMTLYLEWSAIGLVYTVEQMKAFGINPLYYSLHVGIDNASAGHGAIAKKCVEMFLDQVRESEGEAAMQQVWRRIWNGYVAFGTLGTVGEDLFAAANKPTPVDLMIDMINRKAPYASRSHGTKMLGPNLINDWFLDPPGFLQELQNSGLVIPGDLKNSPIFQLISFNGPMYHVFTEDEQKLWQDYVLYLGETKKPAAPKSSYVLMQEVVNFMRQRQTGVTGHKVLLQGPDPADPAKTISLQISEWFALNDNDALMRALSDERNGWIKRYDPAASPLVTAMLAGTGDMAVAFQAVAPDAGGKTFKNIVVEWIAQGCPIGVVGMQAAPPLSKAAVTPVLSAYVSPPKEGRRRRIWGMGTPH